MERLRISPTDPEPGALAHAAHILSRGGLVVFPTDTFYGLGADPRRSDAVERVYGAKGRSAGSALPLIAADIQQVEAAATRLSSLTRRLAARFWPGPLSLVVEAAPAIVAAVRGESGTVAVRVPDQAVARGLAAHVGFAIVSTSANRSGAPAAATADEAVAAIGDQVDLVLDCGAAAGGEPSTIVDARTDRPQLLRAGAVPFSRVLEAV